MSPLVTSYLSCFHCKVNFLVMSIWRQSDLDLRSCLLTRKLFALRLRFIYHIQQQNTAQPSPSEIFLRKFRSIIINSNKNKCCSPPLRVLSEMYIVFILLSENLFIVLSLCKRVLLLSTAFTPCVAMHL